MSSDPTVVQPGHGAGVSSAAEIRSSVAFPKTVWLSPQRLSTRGELRVASGGDASSVMNDPVVVFDRAGGSSSLVRYAAGGGLRVTLASTVSFQAGYAVNVNRGPGEPRGAFFIIGMRFHDVIR